MSIGGGQRQSVRIRANPLALAAYGLNIDDLRTTVGNGNVNTAKGNFDGPSRAYTINANDQLKSTKDYEKLIVAYKNGAPVRLSDVATVEFAPENTKLAAWYNKTPAVILNIQRQPGANVIKVVEGVRALLPALQASLPPAIDVTVLTDRTVTIRASIARRRVRAHARRHPGRARDLRLPAQHPGDDHPEPLGAALARRDLRGHVPARASA